MAQLNSPGVSVTVIDESFYTPSAPGTVPLIIVASGENKANGSNTGIASGTLKVNAGKVYLLTSQRDLSDTFGTPKFYTDAAGNPIHAGELNEYGLQAAYSYLGVSNSAYVVRADIDLSSLEGSTTAPVGPTVDNTTWIDLSNSKFGINEWQYDTILKKYVFKSISLYDTLTISDLNKLDTTTDPTKYRPKSSYGNNGVYVLVATSSLMTLWWKKSINNITEWVEVGSPEWVGGHWVTETSLFTNISTNDTLSINGVSVYDGTTIQPTINGTAVDLVNKINSITSLNTWLTAYTPTSSSDPKYGKVMFSITPPSYSPDSTNGPNYTSVFVHGSLYFVGTLVTKMGLVENQTYKPPALYISSHVDVPHFELGYASGSIWIQTTATTGASWAVKKYNANTNTWVLSKPPLLSGHLSANAKLDPINGGLSIPINTMYLKYNDSNGRNRHNGEQPVMVFPDFADFKLYRRRAVGKTIAVSSIIGNNWDAQSYSFCLYESRINNDSYFPVNGTATISFSVVITDDASSISNKIAGAINANTDLNYISAIVTNSNQITIIHELGGEILVVDGTQTPISKLFPTSNNNTYTNNFYRLSDGNYLISNWTATSDLDKTISFSIPDKIKPTTDTIDGGVWYDSTIEEVDIMVNDGTKWMGYRNMFSGTNVTGPHFSVLPPTTTVDGSPFVENDIWISTANLEKYPQIYIYKSSTWSEINTDDQITQNGIVFADVRWATTGSSKEQSSIADLLLSDFVDFDAPDPALFPAGILLWNLRRSGFNIKRFVRNYIDLSATNTFYTAPNASDNELMTDYYPHRWVTESPNQANGVGSFGRIAQRSVILKHLTSLINTNQEIRDEDSRIFNLIAAPGYVELLKPLVGLNYDRGISAFVVGDTPARLVPDATTLSNWGNNVNNSLGDTNDGLVTTDAYLGLFYPWGYSTDNIGNNIAVPPSHMMLRTIALSDSVSYPWFPPAGVRRGGITNASAVGYLNDSGEFQAVALNNGHRGVLADIHVNPLTYLSNVGLVNYGQKTRQLVPSSLDRINVARLIIYMRAQLDIIAKPFIFEVNDRQTRNEIKQQIEKFILELIGQRALTDALVVCDTSNNTPARIDRHELYVDIAIEPTSAIEFIYIPLRLKNTGEISQLG